MFRRGTAVVAIAVVWVAVVAAQDKAARFEVASVRRNTSGTTQANAQVLPNGVNLVNLPLRGIIGLAYGPMNPNTSIEGPDWINTARFDIIARTSGEVASGELRGMLQALLAERFKLVTRTEKRQLTVQALVLARGDGRLGPQIQRSTSTARGRKEAPSHGASALRVPAGLDTSRLSDGRSRSSRRCSP